MLFNLLRSGSWQEALVVFLMTVPSILIALTFHEVAHGYVAYKCGDPTAKYMGRLTLNPVKHLDFLGTVLMLLTGYGWAKPVPVNSRYFKNPRKGMALTALAGPMTNLILGFFGVIIRTIIVVSFSEQILIGKLVEYNVPTAAADFFAYFAMINLVYAVFNMIPLPPFDGSRVFLVFLPTKYYFGIMKYERIIMLVVLLGMAMGFFWTPVANIVELLLTGMEKLAFMIF